MLIRLSLYLSPPCSRFSCNEEHSFKNEELYVDFPPTNRPRRGDLIITNESFDSLPSWSVRARSIMVNMRSAHNTKKASQMKFCSMIESFPPPQNLGKRITGHNSPGGVWGDRITTTSSKSSFDNYSVKTVARRRQGFKDLKEVLTSFNETHPHILDTDYS